MYMQCWAAAGNSIYICVDVCMRTHDAEREKEREIERGRETFTESCSYPITSTAE